MIDTHNHSILECNFYVSNWNIESIFLFFKCHYLLWSVKEDRRTNLHTVNIWDNISNQLLQHLSHKTSKFIFIMGWWSPWAAAMQKCLAHDQIIERFLLLRFPLNSSFVFIEVLEEKGYTITRSFNLSSEPGKAIPCTGLPGSLWWVCYWT